MGKLANIKDKRPPATLAEANAGSHPLFRMMGEALEELGGVDFIATWAEENPGDFMRLMVSTIPNQTQGGPRTQGAATNFNINLHPGLAPGPLDGMGPVVDEQ